MPYLYYGLGITVHATFLRIELRASSVCTETVVWA